MCRYSNSRSSQPSGSVEKRQTRLPTIQQMAQSYVLVFFYYSRETIIAERLLIGNLRRVMYESGDDVTDMESVIRGSGNQIKLGRYVNTSLGAADIPVRKVPTYWTLLRQDWVRRTWR